MGFWTGKRVVVTGGAGFIGSHVVKALVEEQGVPRENIHVPRSRDCDLRVIANAERAFAGADVVIHLAAVTGGIAFSRSYPATQYYDSTLIDLNVAEAARRSGVQKLVAIGNLFAYAGDAPVPLSERDLFNGLPTEAHRGVGWLKRNLAILADLYHREHGLNMVVVYSANAYGPGDSLDPKHAHVIPATILKCLTQDRLVVWGDGSPSRDFLFVEDIARGLLLSAERLDAPNYANIGSGHEITIRSLVELIVKSSGFAGEVSYDASKSGGDARRCVDVRIASQLIGFEPQEDMAGGIEKTVQWCRRRLAQPGAARRGHE